MVAKLLKETRKVTNAAVENVTTDKIGNAQLAAASKADGKAGGPGESRTPDKRFRNCVEMYAESPQKSRAPAQGLRALCRRLLSGSSTVLLRHAKHLNGMTKDLRIISFR